MNLLIDCYSINNIENVLEIYIQVNICNMNIK